MKNLKKKSISLPGWMPGAAACLFFIMFILASAVMAFPSFAYRYTPAIPVVKELIRVHDEKDKMAQEMAEVKTENETLKTEIKQIKDTEIKEIQTSSDVSAEDREAVQELVIDFVKAQFKGDLSNLKAMCTDDFQKEVDSRKSEIIMDSKGEAIFSTITNVAKQGDKYIVFVRLNNTGSAGQADYQEDFEVMKQNGKFLVSSMGKDA